MNEKSSKKLKGILINGYNAYIGYRIKGLLQDMIEQKEYILIDFNLLNIKKYADILECLYTKYVKEADSPLITSDTRIDIYAHGTLNNADVTHEILIAAGYTSSTSQFLNFLETMLNNINNMKQTDIPLILHLWSCFGGTVNKEYKAVYDGTTLVTHGESESDLLEVLREKIMYHSLSTFLESDSLSSYEQFILDMPKYFTPTTFNVYKDGASKKFEFIVFPTTEATQEFITQIKNKTNLTKVMNKIFSREVNKFREMFPEASNTNIAINEQEAIDYISYHILHILTMEKDTRIANDTKKELIKSLKESNIIKDHTLENLFIWTIVMKQPDNIRLLLECGVNPNLQNGQSVNLLYNLFTDSEETTELNKKIIDLLLDYDIDLNAQNNKGQTPIQSIIMYAKRQNIISEVLDKYSDNINLITTRDRKGNTPLDTAILWVSDREIIVEMFDVVIKNHGVNCKIDEISNRLVHLASMYNDGYLLQHLIHHHKAFINVTNDNGDTPLHIAAENGCDNLIPILIDGAELNAAAPDGTTPLHLAINFGHVSIAETLINAGANVNVQDGNHMTPLHLAANYKVTNDLDAAQHIDYLIIMLIENKADIYACDKNNITALECIFQNRPSAIVANIIEEIGLLDANLLNAAAPGGTTLLHLASNFGHASIAEMLIKAGANVNVQDGNHMTPLHLAANYKVTNDLDAQHIDYLIIMLLQNKADICADDANNITALECIVQNRQFGLVKRIIEERLLDVKRDMNNILQYALKYNKHQLFQYLEYSEGIKVPQVSDSPPYSIGWAKSNPEDPNAKRIMEYSNYPNDLEKSDSDGSGYIKSMIYVDAQLSSAPVDNPKNFNTQEDHRSHNKEITPSISFDEFDKDYVLVEYPLESPSLSLLGEENACQCNIL